MSPIISGVGVDLPLLRSVLNALPDGIAVFDASCRPMMFNQAAERLVGVSMRARDFERWVEVYRVGMANGRSPASEKDCPLSRCLKDGRPASEEFLLRDLDAPEGRWVRADVTPLLDQNGKVTGAVAHYRDATARRKAEQAVALSEQRFAKMFLSSPLAIAVGELESGRLLTANERLAHFFGYGRHEMVGKTALELGMWANPADRQRFMDLLKARRSVRNVDLTFKHRSGALKHAVVSAELIDLPGETVPTLILMIQDETERKALKREIASYESRLKLFIESVREYAIYLLDAEGKVATWNEGARRLKGYSSDEAIGREYATFFVPEDAKAGRPMVELEKALRDGRAETEGWRVRKGGSRFWAHTLITALRGEDGALQGFAKITRDLTETRLAQEASDLRRKEAMQQELIANVSHELRTPIAAIRGFTETLLAGGIDDKRNRRKFLAIIQRHSERLGRLVENILHLSALEHGQKKARVENIALREFCAKFLSAYQPLLDNKGLTAKLSIPASLKVRADWDRLDQALQNLVGNAIKYNRPNGRVTVSARPKGRLVEVSVADTGFGIPKEDLPKLFQRFQRAGQSRKIEGTGLGLSIVKKVIEGWGGKITVESSKKGTTFRFTIPAGK